MGVFQSTRPIRGATVRCLAESRGEGFQSTRPIRGATAALFAPVDGGKHFNPRAPYGARPTSPRDRQTTAAISIHAPHTGRDLSALMRSSSFREFQSTRPIRGATPPCSATTRTTWNFNPRAPYGARLGRVLETLRRYDISIHAPHTGRDGAASGGVSVCAISIHAPHTGRDSTVGCAMASMPHFNPRAPYGARQQKCIIYVLHFCNNRQSKHKNQQETSSVRTFF